MRRLLSVLLLLGAIAAAVWWFVIRPSTAHTCGRIASLCKLEGADVATCKNELGKVVEKLGDDASSRLDKCVAEAKTCPDALGCAAGIGASELKDVGKEALDGFLRALRNK